MTENAKRSCLWKEPGTHWGLLGVTSLDFSGRCLPLWSRPSREAAAQLPTLPTSGKRQNKQRAGAFACCSCQPVPCASLFCDDGWCSHGRTYCCVCIQPKCQWTGNISKLLFLNYKVNDFSEFSFPGTIRGITERHSVGRLLWRLGKQCKKLNIET